MVSSNETIVNERRSLVKMQEVRDVMGQQQVHEQLDMKASIVLEEL